MIPSAEELKKTHIRINDFIHKTPVLSSKSINKIAGCSIYFKCENFQKMGAFKMRGASNALLKLSDQQKKKWSNHSFFWEFWTSRSLKCTIKQYRGYHSNAKQCTFS